MHLILSGSLIVGLVMGCVQNASATTGCALIVGASHAKHAPEVTPNFSYVEFTGRFDHQENAKRYLLCSYGCWAVCSHVRSDERGIKLQFVDCAEIAAKLKAFYGINVLSKAELEAEFQLLPDLPYMSDSDLKYWKPQTMGEALFNWWD